ncbi:MAG TPA: transporter [Burkholderiales bacterium]|nr:transporter [Burkholderiales bacterium]
MQRISPKTTPIAVLAACALVASGSVAHAQSIEPRSYSNAPVGANFLIGGYAYTRGGVSFDTALPITDPRLTTSNAVLGYARALDLWGKSGKFDVIVPYTWLSGSASFQGGPVERQVDGFADPLVRLSVNFYGAPALTLPEFKSYEQDLIVGASLQVSVPVGQYDDTKLVNLGTHRWCLASGTAGVTLFTNNNDFFNGSTRSQDPLYSFQGHAIYNFNSGICGPSMRRTSPAAARLSTER